MELNIEENLAFAATAPSPDEDLTFEAFEDRIGDGFNEYGVRENHVGDELQSVDVVYEAMEPGPPERRNGVRITPDFLRRVAEKDYDRAPPHLMNHAKSESQSKIGDVKDIWFSDVTESLWLMNRVPNTGSFAHDEAIARYTHEPPSWRDGSVGFGNNYEAVRNDAGEPELRDARMMEFSTVNFPGGYDEGGIKAAFCDAAVEAVAEFDDVADEGNATENSATEVRTETITF